MSPNRDPNDAPGPAGGQLSPGIDQPATGAPDPERAGSMETTGNPALSGAGTGMGSGPGRGVGAGSGIQAGTVNHAAEGAAAVAGTPSLGTGMSTPDRGDLQGNAATGGTRGSQAAPRDLEPDAHPQRAPGHGGDRSRHGDVE